MPEEITNIFFDIGDTLGSGRLRMVDGVTRIHELAVFDFVPDLLAKLKDQGLSLGIISNTPEQEDEASMATILTASGIRDFFVPDLMLYSSVVGIDKRDPEIFRMAAERAGYADDLGPCLFVGESPEERAVARRVGMAVAPHPSLIPDVLGGHHFRFARIRLSASQLEEPWWEPIRNLTFVPLYLSGVTEKHLYGVTSSETLRRLDDLGYEVDRLGLPNAPLDSDVYVLRDDQNAASGFLREEGQSRSLFQKEQEAYWILSSSAEGLVVALPAGVCIDDYHLDGAHGHNFKLTADPCLLDPFDRRPGGADPESSLTDPVLESVEIETIKTHLTETRLKELLDRYTGVTDLDAEGPLTNRHTRSQDMDRVITALIKDLETAGNGAFQVFPHRFVFMGEPTDNVVAEFPGEGDEVVILSAHLDATASNSHPFRNYDPLSDPAPGADDDGSGVAAVLAIAEALGKIYEQTRPKRTIRFCLFNAEEQGLVGSKRYAAAEAAAGTVIKAVYQLDMIGFNSDEDLTFEVHIGARSFPGAEAQSRKLVDRLHAAHAAMASPLPLPERYETPMDPADRRSDHSSFHERGYPSCLISENFFGPATGTQPADGNPEYHHHTDTFVDFTYATEIARLAAGAAVLSIKQ